MKWEIPTGTEWKLWAAFRRLGLQTLVDQQRQLPASPPVMGSAREGACELCTLPETLRAPSLRPLPHTWRPTSLNLARYTLSGSMYESKPSVCMAHSRSSPMMVFRRSRWHLSLALRGSGRGPWGESVALDTPTGRRTRRSRASAKPSVDRHHPATLAVHTHSLVTNEINSERHSCTASLASLAILALPGRYFFMFRLMLAMGRCLSCSL